jgi:hypothetical protein
MVTLETRRRGLELMGILGARLASAVAWLVLAMAAYVAIR